MLTSHAIRVEAAVVCSCGQVFPVDVRVYDDKRLAQMTPAGWRQWAFRAPVAHWRHTLWRRLTAGWMNLSKWIRI